MSDADFEHPTFWVSVNALSFKPSSNDLQLDDGISLYECNDSSTQESTQEIADSTQEIQKKGNVFHFGTYGQTILFKSQKC